MARAMPVFWGFQGILVDFRGRPAEVLEERTVLRTLPPRRASEDRLSLLCYERQTCGTCSFFRGQTRLIPNGGTSRDDVDGCFESYDDRYVGSKAACIGCAGHVHGAVVPMIRIQRALCRI